MAARPAAPQAGAEAEGWCWGCRHEDHCYGDGDMPPSETSPGQWWPGFRCICGCHP